MFSRVNGSPAAITRVDMMVRRAKLRSSISSGSGSLIPDPSVFSAARTAATMSMSSRPSRAYTWSGPDRRFESVKCFSMAEAPRATAAIGPMRASRE